MRGTQPARARSDLRLPVGLFGLVVLLAFASATPAVAQTDLTLTVTDVDTSRYPSVSAVLQVGGEAALEGGELIAAATSVQLDGQAISSFSVQPTHAEPLPTATLLLIDESGSMRGGAIGAARRAAEAYITAMRGVDSVSIYAFNEELRRLSDFSSDTGPLVRSLGGLDPRKETALYDALIDSLETAQSQTGTTSRYLVVLSDGGDTVSAATLDQVLAAARAASVQVYAVGLKSDEFDATPLVKITEATGGRYLETPEPDELADLYAGLAREIQNQYVLEMTLDGSTQRSGSGRLDVTVTLGGSSASASRGFFYPETAAIATEATPPSTPAVSPAAPAVSDATSPSPSLLSGFIAWNGSDAVIAVLVAMLLFLAVYVGAVALLPKRDVLTEYADILENRHNLSPKKADSSTPGPIEGFVGKVLKKRGWGDPIQRRIEDVGWRVRTSEFVLMQLTAVIVVAILLGFTPLPLLVKLALVCVVALGPLVLLDRKAARRRRLFEEQVPDVLTLMASSLRAGQGFEQALHVVANEGPDPSAHEFRRLLAQQRLGVPPEESLRTLADRMQSEAFGWVVMVTSIQREVGGNLAEVYTNIAETLRQRAALRREVATLTAEGQLSAIILILLPIGVAGAIYVFNRDYLMLLFTTRGGLIMSGVALALLATGILWIRRVIHFDV